jgi:MFS family permease
MICMIQCLQYDVGMFNAVNGLGGAGQVDAKASTDSNTAVNATFSVVAFFAGTITNWLGIKKALSFGGLGYCIYTASYLCYNHTQNYGFIVFAGFLLGCCAGVLWAAQGAIMLSYPPEEKKGRYIAVFWMIFNMGGVIGSLVPLGQNIHVTTNSPVSDGTYVGFIILSVIGAGLAWLLCDAKNVVRTDGSRVIMMKNPTFKTEIFGMWETFRSEPYIVFLFPMFFASNWFYTYQFNGVNLAQFNTRTRSLNNVLYWSAQIFGALIFGYFLDLSRFRRTVRAKACWVVLFLLTFAVWGGGYAFQRGYTRADVEMGADTPDDPSDDYPKLDWTDSGYIGPMFLYIFYVSFPEYDANLGWRQVSFSD